MRLQVKGKTLVVSASIRSYAEETLGKLERKLADPTQVELELSLERNPSIAAKHVAEATIWTKGPTLRAREASPDMKASIDQLVDKLERQVTRYREKRQRSRARDNGSAPVEGNPPSPGPPEPPAVKTKQFAVKPMTPQEARPQPALIGHPSLGLRHPALG